MKTTRLVLSGMAFALPSQAAIITIGSGGTSGAPPAGDITVETWIRSDQPTTDSGDNFQYVGALNGSGDQLRGLFGFNLSDPVLDGATINSVTVTVYQSATTTGAGGTAGSYGLGLTALTGTVTNSATWNNDSSKYGADLVSISGSPTSVVQNTPFVFNSNTDLVSYVQNALASDEVQFGLKSDDLEALTERNFWSFGRLSGPGEDVSTAPSITIDFTPIPEPGTTAILLFGGLVPLVRRRR